MAWFGRKGTSDELRSSAQRLLQLLNQHQVKFSYDRLQSGKSPQADQLIPGTVYDVPYYENLRRLDGLLAEIAGGAATIEPISRSAISINSDGFSEGFISFPVETTLGRITVHETLLGDFDNINDEWTGVYSVVRTLTLNDSRGVALSVTLPSEIKQTGIEFPLLFGSPNAAFPLHPWTNRALEERTRQRAKFGRDEFSRSVQLLADQVAPPLDRTFDPKRDLPDQENFVSGMAFATADKRGINFRECTWTFDGPKPITDDETIITALKGCDCVVGRPLDSNTTDLYLVMGRNWEVAQQVATAIAALEVLEISTARYDGDCGAVKVITRSGTLVVAFDSSRFSPRQAITAATLSEDSDAITMGIEFRKHLREVPSSTFIALDGLNASQVSISVASEPNYCSKEIWVATNLFDTTKSQERRRPKATSQLMTQHRIFRALANVDGVFVGAGVLPSKAKQVLEFVPSQDPANMNRLTEALRSLQPETVKVEASEGVELDISGVSLRVSFHYDRYVQLVETATPVTVKGLPYLTSAVPDGFKRVYPQPLRQIQAPDIEQLRHALAGNYHQRTFTTQPQSADLMLERASTFNVPIFITGFRDSKHYQAKHIFDVALVAPYNFDRPYWSESGKPGDLAAWMSVGELPIRPESIWPDIAVVPETPHEGTFVAAERNGIEFMATREVLDALQPYFDSCDRAAAQLEAMRAQMSLPELTPTL